MSLLWFLPFVLLSVARADEIKVPLVGLGWQITFEGPTLKQAATDYRNGVIQFRGNAGLFSVSLFVEPPPADPRDSSNGACRDYYWTLSKRNPDILTDSIAMGSAKNCEFVTYRTRGGADALPVTQDHVNCYFVHQGKWVDVHVSIHNPTPVDTQTLQDFAAKVAYGEWQASKGEAVPFALGELGTARLVAPEGWLTGNLVKDDSDKKNIKYTLSFCSPTDANSSAHLTLFVAPNMADNRENLNSELEESTSGIAKASVEGKTVIRALTMQKGVGAIAAFTDKNLVGKPVTPGNAKSIISGMIVPKKQVLGIVSLLSDDAEGEDAKKMVKALEAFTLY